MNTDKFKSRKYRFTLYFLLFLGVIVVSLIISHALTEKDNTTLIISLVGTMWAVIGAYFYANVQQKKIFKEEK